MWKNVILSCLDKTLGDTKDANVGQNIAHMLDFKVKQQHKQRL